MNHSCQQKVLVDNILCVAMKLSALPSKVTVVTPMVFKMVEQGTQSHLITTAVISGWEIVFFRSCSLENCLER